MVPIFTLPSHYRALQHHLKEAFGTHPLKLIAYSLMPNHWQLIVGQTDPARLNRYLARVTSAQHVGRHDEWFAAAEPLGTVADLLRAARDAEREALRGGLVRRAQDWPWNSLSERLQPTGRLDVTPAPFLASQAWVDFVNSPQTEDQTSRVRARRPAAVVPWPSLQRDY